MQMTTVEQDYHPTAAEIAVRALSIWKKEWVPQEFQPHYLEQAREELLAERFVGCDEQTVEA
ncbi:MAG: hypothetical protein NTY01_24745 [Verrucomicrobia bacterium]|nr:hypothetical protein [Verrucomicrobiota bacterium]